MWKVTPSQVPGRCSDSRENVTVMPSSANRAVNSPGPPLTTAAVRTARSRRTRCSEPKPRRAAISVSARVGRWCPAPVPAPVTVSPHSSSNRLHTARTAL